MSSAIHEKREWVVRKRAQGWSLDEIAGHAQVPRSTCHRWITWGEDGRTLENLSRRPKRIKKKVGWFVIAVMIEYIANRASVACRMASAHP